MSPQSGDEVAPPSSSINSPSPSYTVSTLQLSDLDQWLDHLATSFAHKGTPRSYFHRHILNDPYLDYSGIIVLHTPTTPCVSSIRVFLRPIYIDGQPTMVGGIGEVSTQPQWRGRGYAEECLKRGMAYLSGLGVHLSSLHTSNVASYYHKLGWRKVERVFVLVDMSTLTRTSSTSSPPSSQILPLTPDQLVASSPLLSSLSSLYSSYAVQFNGPVQRSDEYWATWIVSELAHSLSTPSPVLCYTYHQPLSPSSTPPSCSASSSSSPSPPLAYLFAQRVTSDLKVKINNGDETTLTQHLLIREFACDEQLRLQDGGRAAFDELVRMAAGTEERQGGGLMIKVPLPIASLFQPPLPVSYTQEDNGFMYRPVDDEVDETSLPPTGRYTRKDFTQFNPSSADDLMQRLHNNARTKHLFFPTDAF